MFAKQKQQSDEWSLVPSKPWERQTANGIWREHFTRPVSSLTRVTFQI